MAKTLPNITYETDGKDSHIIDSPSSMYKLPFEKDEEYFSNLESRVRFIKGCEKLVRSHPRYRAYINELKTKVKLGKCQVFKNLTSEDCTIEMHHGPIFTLYDYCDIMIDHFLEKGRKITTFSIADAVLTEHWKNNIQIVMLSTTVHQEVHEREIFISTNQAWGNLGKFLKKYHLSDDLREKYNRYMDRSLMMDSTAYEILKLNEKLIH